MVCDDLLLPAMNVQRLVVLQSKLIQYGRLEIVGRHNVFDRSMTKLIRFSKGHARLESTAGQPNTEPLTVVIAAGFLWRTVLLCDW